MLLFLPPRRQTVGHCDAGILSRSRNQKNMRQLAVLPSLLPRRKTDRRDPNFRPRKLLNLWSKVVDALGLEPRTR